MIRSCMVLLAMLALYSCKSDNLPSDLLPASKMTSVMKQMLTADEWIGWRREKDTSFAVFPESVHRYRAVFASEGISETQFRSSFAYYQQHPSMLRAVFDSLLQQPLLDSVHPRGKPRRR
jgi:hypothetical protein